MDKIFQNAEEGVAKKYDLGCGIVVIAASNLRIPIDFATSRYGSIKGINSKNEIIIVPAIVAVYFPSLNFANNLKRGHNSIPPICIHLNFHTNLVGLGHSKYNYFEIIFYLNSSVVKIQDSGDNINIFEIPENRPTTQYKSKLNFNNSKSGKGVIKDYMLSVYNYILSDGKDNLNESILINQKLIEISHLCQS